MQSLLAVAFPFVICLSLCFHDSFALFANLTFFFLVLFNILFSAMVWQIHSDRYKKITAAMRNLNVFFSNNNTQVEVPPHQVKMFHNHEIPTKRLR